MNRLMSACLAAVLLFACKEEAPAAASPPASATATGATNGTTTASTNQAAAPHAMPTGAKPAGAGLSGKVLETSQAGGYTYLKLQTPGGEEWAAIPEAQVEVGQEVVVLNPMPMVDFQSKTMNRTFPRIAFGSGLAGTGAKTGEASPFPHGGAAATPVPAEPIKVEKAAGPEGRTVGELHATKAKLSGKPVAVRGKIVKYAPGILGKNWAHLQDGTGEAGAKTDTVVVTTLTELKKGDVVTAKGVLALDKDIGAGYVYPLLIEDAAITK